MSCAKSELCIFDRAVPQVVVENAAFEEIFPINNVIGSSRADIEFNINGSSTDYLDLNDTLLFVKFQVKKKVAGNLVDLVEADKVIPANFLFHNLFKDAILSLNNVRIEGGNNVYSHKAALDCLLNYSSDTKETNLTSIGYDDDENVRKTWIEKSKAFSMCGPLRLDFLDQPKYLLPGVNVHIRLQRNSPNFCLKSDKLETVIEFLETKLFIRRVKVEPSVLMGHHLGLEKQNAYYPIRKTQFVSYSLAKGSLSFYKDQIFGDMQLPKFVVVAFQNTNQFNGSNNTLPTEYKNLNVSSITLSRNTDYRETYNTDFKNDDIVDSYVKSIIRNMGNLDKNLNNGITLKTFKETYPIFTFNLAPDFDINQTQLPKQGNLRLDIKFDEAFKDACSVLIYGIFDSEIQITKNRTIIV